MSINKTSVSDSSEASNTICTEELEHLEGTLCQIYNWFGGLTNLFRLTGEVVSDIEGYPPPSSDGYGNKVKITKETNTIFL